MIGTVAAPARIDRAGSRVIDKYLFHTASCENHCLHHLLPVAKSTKYELRAVGLSSEHVLSELHKKTFINKMVFADCY